MIYTLIRTPVQHRQLWENDALSEPNSRFCLLIKMLHLFSAFIGGEAAGWLTNVVIIITEEDSLASCTDSHIIIIIIIIRLCSSLQASWMMPSSCKFHSLLFLAILAQVVVFVYFGFGLSIFCCVFLLRVCFYFQVAIRLISWSTCWRHRCMYSTFHQTS